MEDTMRLKFIRIAPLIASACFLVPATLSLPAAMNGLTPEDQEILDHMKLIYLSDGQGQMMKTLDISGLNVRIHNGTCGATTAARNGLGNLIIGKNERRTVDDHRTGSHNLVVGSYNNYSGHGGLVVGEWNTVSGDFASVSGGTRNIASGDHASISGGWMNTAGGDHASVSGGRENQAKGGCASICGGRKNVASGPHSTISGGFANDTRGSSSSISGGGSNRTYGELSSVSGGLGGLAMGSYDWVAGTIWEDH